MLNYVNYHRDAQFVCAFHLWGCTVPIEVCVSAKTTTKVAFGHKEVKGTRSHEEKIKGGKETRRKWGTRRK